MQEAAFEIEEENELIEPLQILLEFIQDVLWKQVDTLMVVQMHLYLLRSQLSLLLLPRDVYL